MHLKSKAVTGPHSLTNHLDRTLVIKDTVCPALFPLVNGLHHISLILRLVGQFTDHIHNDQHLTKVIVIQEIQVQLRQVMSSHLPLLDDFLLLHGDHFLWYDQIAILISLHALLECLKVLFLKLVVLIL